MRASDSIIPRMPMTIRLAMLLALIWPALAGAETLRRATVWDLKLGEPIAAQPAPDEYRGFACGSNGGAPRAQLKGWSDFARCRAEGDGLREVYFEYDDEFEYIARAKDLEREITRWAGTTEVAFPIVVSALFDDAGVLKGIRIVTDARPEHRNDITEANLRKRVDAYVLGSMLAARYDIAAARDCKSLPAAEGESEVGTLFVKQLCEKADPQGGRKFLLSVNLYRKPGQSGVNPQLPSQLTEGQFESSTRFEIRQLDR
jgi:hypothetical protein